MNKFSFLSKSIINRKFTSILPSSINALNLQCRSFSTPTTTTKHSLINPTEEHASMRAMIRLFVETEVDPQALEYNRKEEFNVELFRKLGDLGLLGITVNFNNI
jgi:alkylation response protein AidB-like acyl-CoA dehydrogenase